MNILNGRDINFQPIFKNINWPHTRFKVTLGWDVSGWFEENFNFSWTFFSFSIFQLKRKFFTFSHRLDSIKCRLAKTYGTIFKKIHFITFCTWLNERQFLNFLKKTHREMPPNLLKFSIFLPSKLFLVGDFSSNWKFEFSHFF